MSRSGTEAEGKSAAYMRPRRSRGFFGNLPSQDLLVRNKWQGADVEDLVRAQLAHFADLVGSQIVIDGPKLRLKAAGTQAIGIALYELGRWQRHLSKTRWSTWVTA